MIQQLQITIRCMLTPEEGNGVGPWKEMVCMNFPTDYDMTSEIYQAIKNIRDKDEQRKHY